MDKICRFILLFTVFICLASVIEGFVFFLLKDFEITEIIRRSDTEL